MTPFHIGERSIWTIWFGILPRRPWLALVLDGLSTIDPFTYVYTLRAW